MFKSYFEKLSWKLTCRDWLHQSIFSFIIEVPHWLLLLNIFFQMLLLYIDPAATVEVHNGINAWLDAQDVRGVHEIIDAV